MLAAIGHDVRTPMNSILGICALLLDGDLDEAQRKWLWRIRASCEALLAMLNGMLEIAAAGVDGAEIHREAIDVASLVEEVADVLRPQAEDKGLELLVVIEASVAGIWNTDSTRLRQVLFNLCGNAIKYTFAGSVEIRALTERDKAGVELLRLRVSDTGPGIAADERDVIFEQFRRGRHEASRAHEGLGLGLALCREIATLLGGQLSLDSVEDVGSVFTFEIPVERGSVAGAFDGPLAGRTALVVGLSEGVRRRVASHLESIGFEVETAGDGFMAVGLAERIAYQHGALDMMVLDAALIGLSADALLARFKASRPLEHLRTVLVVNGSDMGQGATRGATRRAARPGTRRRTRWGAARTPSCRTRWKPGIWTTSSPAFSVPVPRCGRSIRVRRRHRGPACWSSKITASPRRCSLINSIGPGFQRSRRAMVARPSRRHGAAGSMPS